MPYAKYTRAQLVAMTIYGEARNQTLYGQILVGFVIMNRWKKPCWWGKNLREVLFKPEQFDCWKPGNVNLRKITQAMEKCIQGDCNKYIDQALWLADGILTGRIIDTSEDVNHYYKLGSPMPFWARGKEPNIIEDDHAFFRL